MRFPLVLSCAALALAAGCTTYKLWSEGDSDSDLGVVRLTYEYRKFENPQVDERAGIELARERCRDWNYTQAQRKGEQRLCVDGDAADCRKWQVIREYRCTRAER
jgi:hypothetical protein